MRQAPHVPIQSALVAPSKLRLRYEVAWQAKHDYTLCRVDLVAGTNGEQLGLWVGPGPDLREPNEVREFSRATVASALHGINVEFFGGEPF